MSSYFVNPLFSKYKGGESLEPTYYDCRFPQSVARSHTLVYGPGAAAPGFQHPSHHVQDFFHHGTTGISNPGYQQNPCALACHGDATKFYGYEALPRQTLYGTQQDASLAQYPDCKSSSSSNPGEGQGHLNQNSSPSLMFPWMRPHGQNHTVISYSFYVAVYWRLCARQRASTRVYVFVCMCSGYACVHEWLLPIKRNKSEDMMGHIEPVLQAAVTLQHMFVQGWIVAFKSAFKHSISDHSSWHQPFEGNYRWHGIFHKLQKHEGKGWISQSCKYCIATHTKSMQSDRRVSKNTTCCDYPEPGC